MKKIRRTIGIIIDTAASFAIYALIALLVLFIAGQVKHYYDVGYGVFSQVSKDAKGTGITAPVVVTEGMKAADLAQQLEEEGLIASAGTFLLPVESPYALPEKGAAGEEAAQEGAPQEGAAAPETGGGE